MMGTVSLKGMAEAMVMMDFVARSERDTPTENMIQTCVQETAIATVMTVVKCTDSLDVNRYVFPVSPSYC